MAESTATIHDRSTHCHGRSDQHVVDLRSESEHVVDHARLVERAQAHDPEAVNELIDAFRPLVERIARRRCSRTCDVDDVIQDVWVAMITGLESIRSPERLPGWLRRVTVNVTIHHGRKNRAVPVAEPPEPRRTGRQDVPYESVEVETTRTSVHRALATLKSADRVLIDLLMAEDRPDYSAVSQAVDRPVGSIGPTRSRVLHRLGSDPAIVRLRMGERLQPTAC
jgi:RNA polymerase sigma factor (sigma-70 family)